MVSDRTQSHKALLPTPASDASCKSRLLLMLLTYWLEVFMTLSLSSVNSFEWLTDFRETFIHFYRFTVNDTDEGGHGARPVGRGGSFRTLPGHSTSPRISMQSPTGSWRKGREPEILRTLSSRGFTEAALHKHDWLNHWPLVSTSSLAPLLPKSLWMGLTVPTLITSWLLWVTSPHLWVVVQSQSRVLLFVAPWTVAHQAPLFSTVSWSLLELTAIESVMLSYYLILCHAPFSSCPQEWEENQPYTCFSKSAYHKSKTELNEAFCNLTS